MARIQETLIMLVITLIAGYLGTRNVVSTMSVTGWMFLFTGIYFRQFWTSVFGGSLALATLWVQNYKFVI